MTDQPARLKYVYGPVPSWRLGRSLGIDLVSRDCTCSFDCVYCQLGRTEVRSTTREVFVPTGEIVRELGLLPDGVEMDYATFSGMGEPTLAANLGEVIDMVHEALDVPVAVLTNATLMHRDDVAGELARADTVMAKLDAPSPELFERMNNPVDDVTFEQTLAGVKSFGEAYPQRLVLQMMFCPVNEAAAPELAELARSIRCREIVLNTPLRPCGVEPLSQEAMEKIKGLYSGLPVRTVYDAPPVHAKAVDSERTRWRRPAEGRGST